MTSAIEKLIVPKLLGKLSQSFFKVLTPKAEGLNSLREYAVKHGVNIIIDDIPVTKGGETVGSKRLQFEYKGSALAFAPKVVDKSKNSNDVIARYYRLGKGLFSNTSVGNIV